MSFLHVGWDMHFHFLALPFLLKVRNLHSGSARHAAWHFSAVAALRMATKAQWHAALHEAQTRAVLAQQALRTPEQLVIGMDQAAAATLIDMRRAFEESLQDEKVAVQAQMQMADPRQIGMPQEFHSRITRTGRS